MALEINYGEPARETRDGARFPMVTRGPVQDGVVVLADGVRLPEGQEMTVLADATVPHAPRIEGSPYRSVLDIATARYFVR